VTDAQLFIAILAVGSGLAMEVSTRKLMLGHRADTGITRDR